MGTPEGLRKLLDLVSVDEANAFQHVADIDTANALLERYATTVCVLTSDLERAATDVSRAKSAEMAALARVDGVAAMKVRELVEMTDRATSAKAEAERLRVALDDAENRVENLEIARTIDPRVEEVARSLAIEGCAALCDAAAARWMTLAPGETATRDARRERGNEAAALAAEIRAFRGAP